MTGYTPTMITSRTPDPRLHAHNDNENHWNRHLLHRVCLIITWNVTSSTILTCFTDSCRVNTQNFTPEARADTPGSSFRVSFVHVGPTTTQILNYSRLRRGELKMQNLLWTMFLYSFFFFTQRTNKKIVVTKSMCLQYSVFVGYHLVIFPTFNISMNIQHKYMFCLPIG